MDETQRQKLASLLAKEHVGVLITQGEDWPSGTMQAFAEDQRLHLIFIMGVTSEKFQNLLKHPRATVLVDTRDTGKVETFDITRALIQGIAHEVPRDSAEWESLKAVFLKKNPFEAPFFGMDGLRMIRVRSRRIAYTGADRHMFKIEL